MTGDQVGNESKLHKKKKKERKFFQVLAKCCCSLSDLLWVGWEEILEVVSFFTKCVCVEREVIIQNKDTWAETPKRRSCHIRNPRDTDYNTDFITKYHL